MPRSHFFRQLNLKSKILIREKLEAEWFATLRRSIKATWGNGSLVSAFFGGCWWLSLPFIDFQDLRWISRLYYHPRIQYVRLIPTTNAGRSGVFFEEVFNPDRKSFARHVGRQQKIISQWVIVLNLYRLRYEKGGKSSIPKMNSLVQENDTIWLAKSKEILVDQYRIFNQWTRSVQQTVKNG